MVVRSSDAGRFEGTVWVCSEEDDGVGFALSFCGWGWGFGAWIGMSSAAGSVGASGLCEKMQEARLQFWMSGHLVFLNSPRLENMAVGPRTRPTTANNRGEEWGEFNLRDSESALKAWALSCRAASARQTPGEIGHCSPPPLHLPVMATKRNVKQRARGGSVKDQLERIEFVFLLSPSATFRARCPDPLAQDRSSSSPHWPLPVSNVRSIPVLTNILATKRLVRPLDTPNCTPPRSPTTHKAQGEEGFWSDLRTLRWVVRPCAHFFNVFRT